MPGAGRLVRGIEAAAWGPEERKAAEVRSRRLEHVQSGKLGFCRVGPLPVRFLHGCNRQAQGDAAGPFQQFEDLAVLLPCRAPAACLWALAPFLGGVVFLADLALEGPTWALRAAARPFFLGGVRLPNSGGGARFSFLRRLVGHSEFFLWRLITAVTTFITLLPQASKLILQDSDGPWSR
jgi:hypothetical protein